MAESPSELRVEIEKLERKHAENPEGRFFVPLANAYRKLGAVEHAESLLRDGLRRHPDYLSAHVVLGRCLADQRATSAAVEEFRYVLSLDPQNLIALRSLAELSLTDGRSADAVHWYRELLAVDPMNEDARRALDDLAGPTADAAAGASVHEEPPFRDDWLEPLDDGTAEAGYRWDETETVPGDRAVSETAEDIGLVHFDGGMEREEDRSELDSTPFEEDRREVVFDDGDLQPEQSASFASFEGPSADPLPGLEQPLGEAGRGYVEAEPVNGAIFSDQQGDATEPPALVEGDPFGTPESGEQENGWPALEDDSTGSDTFHQPTASSGADDVEDADEDGPGELATETIAELYARQGFYARAAEVLREVIRRRGGDEALSRRLAEIERLAAGGEPQDPAAVADQADAEQELRFEADGDGEDAAEADLDSAVAGSSWSDRESDAEPISEAGSGEEPDAVRYGFLEMPGEDDAAEELPALPGLNGGYTGAMAAAGGAGVGRFEFDDSDTGRESEEEPVEEDAFADSFTHGFHAAPQMDSVDDPAVPDHAESTTGSGGDAEEEPWGGDVYATNAGTGDSMDASREPPAGGEQDGETIADFLRALVSWKRSGSDVSPQAGGAAGSFDDEPRGQEGERQQPAGAVGGGFAPTWSPEGEAGSAGDADETADIASLWEPAEQAAPPSEAANTAAAADADAMPDWLDAGPEAPGRSEDAAGDPPLYRSESGFPQGTGSAAEEEPYPWEVPAPGMQAPEGEGPAGESRERGSELEDYLAFDEEPVRSSDAAEEADHSFEAYLAYDDEPGAAAPSPVASTPEPEPAPALPAPTPTPVPSAPTPAASATPDDEDDLESFQTWLRSLKR